MSSDAANRSGVQHPYKRGRLQRKFYRSLLYPARPPTIQNASQKQSQSHHVGDAEPSSVCSLSVILLRPRYVHTADKVKLEIRVAFL